MKKIMIGLIVVIVLFANSAVVAGEKQHDYMPSLITKTPLEGRMLAITIVRKTVGTIQRSGDVKHKLRAVYSEDPEMLMRAVELVNMEFKIIAKANNYWR